MSDVRGRRTREGKGRKNGEEGEERKRLGLVGGE